MTWQFPPYTPGFVITIVISLWLALSVWQRRNVPGVRVFAVMLIASSFWLFTRLLEAAAYEYWAKIFWAKTEYFGILVVSPAWFVFTCYYARQLKSFPIRTSILMAIIPVSTLFIVWTNEYHHLIWTTITRSPTNPEILNYDHGAWFWFIVVYNYAFLLTGIFNLATTFRTMPQQFHTQARFLMLGSLIPIIGNVLYVFGLSPAKGMDLTPFCLTITAVIYSLTVFRFRLFDIRHVARASIIETMSEGMLLVDEKNRILDINPSVLRLLNLPKTIAAQDARVALAQYPAILSLIETPPPQPVTQAIGETDPRYLDIQVSELGDALGQSAGKLITFRDVTERHTNEKIAFETAIEEHRIRLLKQLMENMSHEYRTPLANINTSLYLLGKSTNPDSQQKYRDTIQLQVERLDYLINEMLTIIQIDTGLILADNTISVADFLDAMIDELRPIFTAKQQQLILKPAENPLHIKGDSLLLRKAFSHILQNANRYTPSGGTITVSSDACSRFATVAIHDSGVGMSVETKAHIFERFYREDAAHSTPGFGLGLPIAQGIIEKHGGRIEVESSPDAGATFTVYLPQVATETAPHPTLELATI